MEAAASARSMAVAAWAPAHRRAPLLAVPFLSTTPTHSHPKCALIHLEGKKDSVGWGVSGRLAGNSSHPTFQALHRSHLPYSSRVRLSTLTSNDIMWLHSQGCGYITHAPNPNPSALYSGTVRTQLETKGKRRKGLHLKCMRLNYSRV